MNRNYDAAIGRFADVDPMAEGAESMISCQYAGNNPIMYNDPLGNQQDYLGYSDLQIQLINSSAGLHHGNVRGHYEPGEDGDIGGGSNWVSNGEGAAAALNMLWGSLHGGTADGTGVYEYDSEASELAAGYSAYSQSGLFGSSSLPGAARSYAQAVFNYDSNPNRQTVLTVGGDFQVVGSYYHDISGNSMVFNGVSGTFATVYVGEGEEPGGAASQGGAWQNFKDGFGDPLTDWKPGITGSTVVAAGSLLANAAEYGNRLAEGVYGVATSTGTLRLATAGRLLGVAGLGITAVSAIANGNFTVGTGVKLAIGAALVFSPVGWGVILYSAADLGIGVLTGRSITDRIGDGVDNVIKKW